MKENMNTINTTKYINMLDSNSKFRIELVEQYDLVLAAARGIR